MTNNIKYSNFIVIGSLLNSHKKLAMKKGKTPPISHSIGRSSFLLMALILLMLFSTSQNSFGGNKLFGTVTSVGLEPVDDAFVVVYRLHDIYRYPIFLNFDETNGIGVYKVDLGNTNDTVYALAFPQGSTSYSPTFYPSNIDWETAGDIIFPGTFPGGNGGKDIIAVGLGWEESSSQNSIEGNVSMDVKSLNSQFGSMTFAYALKDGKVYGYSQVDANGKFNIQSLSQGTYEVMVTGIGYKTQRSTVELAGTNKRANLNFDMTLGSSAAEKNFSNNVKLSQNYPNPFNPSTEIRFEIPENSLVKLQIFDAAGRQVALLVNTALNKGAHSVNFNGASLTTGVYFYRLSAGTFTETKKMLLIK